MAAGREELDNLTGTQTIQSLSPKEKEELKERTRIRACDNKTHEIYVKISASDLDAAMLRFLLSWGASSPNNCLASLDVAAAFLNAALRHEDLRPYSTSFN